MTGLAGALQRGRNREDLMKVDMEYTELLDIVSALLASFRAIARRRRGTGAGSLATRGHRAIADKLLAQADDTDD